VCFDGGSKASLYCVLRDRWKKYEKQFGLSKHIEKHWAPWRHYKQAASIESESLLWLVGVARGPVWRGAR